MEKSTTSSDFAARQMKRGKQISGGAKNKKDMCECGKPAPPAYPEI